MTETRKALEKYIQGCHHHRCRHHQSSSSPLLLLLLLLLLLHPVEDPAQEPGGLRPAQGGEPGGGEAAVGVGKGHVQVVVVAGAAGEVGRGGRAEIQDGPGGWGGGWKERLVKYTVGTLLMHLSARQARGHTHTSLIAYLERVRKDFNFRHQ